MFLLYIVIYPSALITLELSFICLRYRSFYYAFLATGLLYVRFRCYYIYIGLLIETV